MKAGQVSAGFADTGPALRAKGVPLVFDEFESAKNEQNEESPGPGLGLSIARHVVEMYGGKIRAESGEFRGSVFSFRLPVQLQ